MKGKDRVSIIIQTHRDISTLQESDAHDTFKQLIASARKLALLVCLSVLSVSVLTTPPLYGQATSGSIVGMIVDSSGAAISGATVTVTNAETLRSMVAQTDKDGNYSVLFLIPDHYEVDVKHSGFGEVQHSAFALAVDQTARINLMMPVASVNQTVTVSSAAPLLNTDTSDIGAVITAQQIVALPLNTRNFTQLLTLTSGTSPNTNGQGSSSSVDFPQGPSAINVNGVPSDGNNWQLDGISDDEAFFNVAAIIPSPDALQEFKSITSNYSAEFGEAGGAVVQISTKSGSNAFHGAAFEFVRNAGLDANDYFSKQNNSPIPPYTQNQFGGTLGGPIKRDKTFFFGDYEGFRSSEGLTAIRTVPTALQREGVFTEYNQPQIYDPITHQPYLNNTITNVDPVATMVMALVPMPNILVNGAPMLVNNIFASTQLDQGINQGDGRIDTTLSSKDQAFVRYSVEDATYDEPPFLGPLAGGGPGLAATSQTLNQNVAISDTHTLSPNVINVVRIGLNRVRLDWGAYDAGSDIATQIGIPGINDFCPLDLCGGLPQISIAGSGQYGHTNYAPTKRHESIYQLIDTLTMVKGSHTINVGTSLSKVRASLYQTSNPVGEFAFDQNLTSNNGSGGIGMASFDTGYYASATRDALLGYPSYNTYSLFFYGADNIRATRKLTLNLGLRYAIYTAPTENKNHQANFDIANGNLLIACVATSCTGGIHTQYTNILPRVGFSYSIDPRTVIRSAFGMSTFAEGSGGFIGTLAENQPWINGQQFNSPTIFTAGPTINQGIPAPTPLQPRPGAGSGVFIPTGSQIQWMDPNLRMPRVYQWNLDLQRMIVPNLLFDMAYVGNAGTGLFLSQTFDNPPLDPTSTLTIQERRPYYDVDPDLQGFTARFGGGHSDYHSLQVQLQKNFSNGLSFLAAYTWSKVLATGYTYVNPLDYNIKAVGSQNLPQTFVVSYNYELPVGQGKLVGKNMNAWANAVVGGWTLSGITTFRSGLPFSPVMQNSELDNGLGNVPNQIGSGRLAHPTINEWFNIADFTDPGDQYGNAGFNNLEGPTFHNWDMAVHKNVKFNSDGARYLQLRAEFYNAFNNVQFGLPSTAVCPGTECGAGTVTSLAGTPREIQLAAKFYF